MYLINDSGFKTIFIMTRYIDNWAAIDRGPICTRCNKPKKDHGYFRKAYRCMIFRSSVFTEKTIDTVHSPLTIKRRKEKDSMAKAKIVKMPKVAKNKTAPITAITGAFLTKALVPENTKS